MEEVERLNHTQLFLSNYLVLWYIYNNEVVRVVPKNY